MAIGSLINEIISFPLKFNNLEDISLYSFLKEIGYFKHYNEVYENDVAKTLIQHPECINAWLNWSENKRVTSGWYIQNQENGHYVVGYYPSYEGNTQIFYSDITNACAAFIIKEIEAVRNSQH